MLELVMVLIILNHLEGRLIKMFLK